MVQGCEALTEKVKQTLRLLLVGHDAKSMARHLALSASNQSPAGEVATASGTEATVAKIARGWLTLVDEGDRTGSWAGAAQTFQSLNTVDAWRSASEKARVPLGSVLSRALLSEQNVPAPPNGYRMVRFRTDFANKHGATETVTLDREGEDWKVVGIYID
jgi:hypothetical protein